MILRQSIVDLIERAYDYRSNLSLVLHQCNKTGEQKGGK